MEQFVLVLPSVYTVMSLQTEKFNRQEIQKYRAEQNPSTKMYHLKGHKKKMFARADSLVDKNLSFSRIMISKSQTKTLDGVKTGVLLSDFGEQLA